MVIVAEDAAELRLARLADPNSDPDETTEDDVIRSLLVQGYDPNMALTYSARATRLVRLMRKAVLKRR